MTFSFYVSAAVVSAIVSGIVGIITANISKKSAIETAKETTTRELVKMERTWAREDTVSSDEEFAEMAAVVAKWSSWASGAWDAEAIEKVASVRAKETGALGKTMDELYTCINSRMYQKADKLLTDAINERRRLKDQLAAVKNSK